MSPACLIQEWALANVSKPESENDQASRLSAIPRKLYSGVCMIVSAWGIALQALATNGADSSFLIRGRTLAFFGVVLIGLLLGMRHSLDPDHVVAVATIVSRQRSIRHAALIGILWGVGHTLTIFLVGSAIILFGLVIPPRLGLFMEFSVALMLILLGALNLTGAMHWITHRLTPHAEHANPNLNREEEHLGERDSQTDASASDASLGLLDRLAGRFGLYQLLRPLILGVVHGLAGSAAIALLVLSTIRVPVWAIAYLLVFGLGTIIGMMSMTVGMALPIALTGNRFSKVSGYLSYGSGLVSLAFGLFLVYQIGFVNGFFTSNPQWTPH
jgi:high-affinity nickel permease